jgi:competence ComEA-like helix-hairpin-helix protein
MKPNVKCRLGLAVMVSLGIVSAQSKLPDGEGKAEFQRICVTCHELSVVTNARMSRERWEGMVDDMATRGALGTDEELDKIVDYLSANFGKDKAPPKVNVNQATAKELSAVLGLSAADAEAIVGYRRKNGNFKDWPDLKKVPDIDMKKLEDNKERIQF